MAVAWVSKLAAWPSVITMSSGVTLALALRVQRTERKTTSKSRIEHRARTELVLPVFPYFIAPLKLSHVVL